MNGHLNIDKYDDEADYAIFDDISGGFQFFPSYKGGLAAKKNSSARTNTEQRLQSIGETDDHVHELGPLADPHVDVAWLMLNCMIVHIEDPLVEII